MESLYDTILNELGKMGWETKIYNAVTEPRSRFADPFHEIRCWKKERIYFLQFGRIDGSRIFYGTFSLVKFSPTENRIYRVYCCPVPAEDFTEPSNLRKLLSELLQDDVLAEADESIPYRAAFPSEVFSASFIY